MQYTLRGKITKGFTYQIDNTLTIEGVSADAKATGDAINTLRTYSETALHNHVNNTKNPHSVTKAQVGLGNVDNTSDMEKPVSNAQATAIADAKKAGTDAQTAADNAKTAADNAQTAANAYTDTQVKKAAPRNLLDNSDFRNPVNQRGDKDYLQQDSYTIDRWTIYATNGRPGLSVMDGYILFKGGVYQKLDIDASKTYTFAVMTGNNEILCVSGVPTTPVTATKGNNTIVLGRDHSNNLVQVGVSGVYETITDSLKWAALYEGEYTAETLPPYVPKGYAAELAECCRYFMRGGIEIVHYLPGGGFRIEIPLIQPFRIVPTINLPGKHLIYNNNAATFEAKFSWLSVDTNAILIVFSSDGSSSVTPGYSYIADIEYELSADL